MEWMTKEIMELTDFRIKYKKNYNQYCVFKLGRKLGKKRMHDIMQNVRKYQLT